MVAVVAAIASVEFVVGNYANDIKVIKLLGSSLIAIKPVPNPIILNKECILDFNFDFAIGYCCNNLFKVVVGSFTKDIEAISGRSHSHCFIVVVFLAL